MEKTILGILVSFLAFPVLAQDADEDFRRCESRYQNDTISLTYISETTTQACNICGSCERGDKVYHQYQTRQYDIGCMRNMSTTSIKAISDQYDCSWNGGTYPVNHLFYGRNSEVIRIKENCEAIRQAARQMNIRLTAGFCSNVNP